MMHLDAWVIPTRSADNRTDPQCSKSDQIDIANGRVTRLHAVETGLNLACPHLAASSETQDEMQRRLLLDIVVAQSSAIFKLLSSKDQSLLVWRDTLLILDLGLDIINSVGRLDFKRDRLACQRLYENLHTTTEA